jgi:hypothetical protein
MLSFLFCTDTGSACYGELRPVEIDQATPDGWTGRHASERANGQAPQTAWSRSAWTMEPRPSNDRLSFLAITLRERAIATWITYQPHIIKGEEWKVIHKVIDFVDDTNRPDMATASDNEVIAYLTLLNELRTSLENIRLALDIRHEVKEKSA